MDLFVFKVNLVYTLSARTATVVKQKNTVLRSKIKKRTGGKKKEKKDDAWSKNLFICA